MVTTVLLVNTSKHDIYDVYRKKKNIFPSDKIASTNPFHNNNSHVKMLFLLYTDVNNYDYSYISRKRYTTTLYINISLWTCNPCINYKICVLAHMYYIVYTRYFISSFGPRHWLKVTTIYERKYHNKRRTTNRIRNTMYNSYVILHQGKVFNIQPNVRLLTENTFFIHQWD